MLCRYLIYFAYIGKSYRGLQIQTGTKTVQGVLQEFLRKKLKYPGLLTSTSSRTDVGVNAFSNTLHFDLPLGTTLDDGQILQPPCTDEVAKNLNVTFKYLKEDIRVLKIQRVPRNFHCRSDVLTRTYLYRLAVSGRQKVDINDFHNQIFMESPAMEFVRGCFDTDKFIQAAELFSGRHDFSHFTTPEALSTVLYTATRSAIVHIRRGNLMSNEFYEGNRCLELWDIDIASRSYMYKQVRRMVGVMIRAGQGQIDLAHVKELLNGKDVHTQHSRSSAASHGLFLRSIVYRPEAFTFQDDSMDQDEHLEEGSIFEGPSRVNVDSEDLINPTDSLAPKDGITEDSCLADVYIGVVNSQRNPLSEGCVNQGVSISKEDSVSNYLKQTEDVSIKSDVFNESDPSVLKMDPSDIDSDMDPSFRINSSDSGHTETVSGRMTESK